jgi:hypothetical protein
MVTSCEAEAERHGDGLAPGFRRLKAERLTPERLTTVAVTRHLMNHFRRINYGLRFPFDT